MILTAVRFIFVIAAVLLVAMPAAHAQWPPLDSVAPVDAGRPNDVAVIVTIEDYLLLPDIRGAVDNANEWEVFLRNGLKVPSVHVLANQNATREEILKFAKLAAQEVGEGGTLWFVFIGHGAPSVDGKDGLLVGMDAQQSVESLGARGVSQSELLAELEQGKGRTMLLVDACFSGRSADGSALAAGVQPVVAVNANAALSPKSIVLTAAKATEVAGQLDGAPRPAFSYLILGALRGWADDGDGRVTAAEALYYAQRVLRGVKGRQQTPQGVGDLGADLVTGVTERKPLSDNQIQVEPTPQEVVAEPTKIPTTDVAALTLEYLQRRLVFEGRTVRQAGRVLEGPAFYHAIERPDLADKWKSHNPWMWLPGIGLIGGGIALFVWGLSERSNEIGSRSSGRILGGTMGGFFVLSGGVCLVTFGFVFDHNPMNFSERKSAAEALNKKLREERGLGPEVDWQNEPAKKRNWGMGLFGARAVPDATAHAANGQRVGGPVGLSLLMQF